MLQRCKENLSHHNVHASRNYQNDLAKYLTVIFFYFWRKNEAYA